MKVDIRDTAGVVEASALRIGQMGRVVGDGDYEGHVFLRTFSGVVSLNDPAHTWRDGHFCKHRVTILPPGSTITLTVE